MGCCGKPKSKQIPPVVMQGGKPPAPRNPVPYRQPSVLHRAAPLPAQAQPKAFSPVIPPAAKLAPTGPSQPGMTGLSVPSQKKCPKCNKSLTRKLRFDTKVKRYIGWFICTCGYESVVA